jgi:phosphoenolpyruvate phosphomutase / 2-hydroxyethylphosphonate cytidylyltransferase
MVKSHDIFLGDGLQKMQNNKRAIILAAGKSRRLSHLTGDIPKSFLKVGNKKLIEIMLDALNERGITSVCILVGYMKNKFFEEIGTSYKNLNITYIQVDEFETCNHSWSLYLTKATHLIKEEDVLILHADTYFDTTILDNLLEHESENVVGTFNFSDFNGETRCLVYGSNGESSSIQYKNAMQEPNLVGEFMGLSKFSKAFMREFYYYLENYFPIYGKKDPYEICLNNFMQLNREKINYVLSSKDWVNINYELDLIKAKNLYVTNNPDVELENSEEKVVYLGMAVDFIHPGHVNIIKKASELGKLVIGLLTDEAICKYKRSPILKYEDRKKIIESIKGVSLVMKENDEDYRDTLRTLKPDIVVHGDDWKFDNRSYLREKIIVTLKEYGGELVEFPSTVGYSESELIEKYLEIGTTPDKRRSKLKELIHNKKIVRILEVHNGLTGRIVEKTQITVGPFIREFDGMWLSSLTDSTAKGKPDTKCVDFTSRAQTIDSIFEVTTKPMIVDADDGGLPEHFEFMVRTLERLGVSAVIIEDKIGAKRNSLFGTDVKQTQDSIENFSFKINSGKKALITNQLMIVARIESLILKAGLEDALKRAKAYIEAGADGIMIHSKERTPHEIVAFCKEYANFERKVSLIVVPSSYSSIQEKDLIDLGVNVVIYANHLLRSAYPAMQKTAKTILLNGRAAEADEFCMPIKDILTLIPGGK